MKPRRLAGIPLFAGSDAHSNIGFHFFGDETGNKLLDFKFDDYAMIFRVVRTHVLLESGKELTQETLLNALRLGHCFIGFDVLGDTKGFSFTAGQKIQGDEVPFSAGMSLEVHVPLPSRISVLKDGQEVGGSSRPTKLRFSPRNEERIVWKSTWTRSGNRSIACRGLSRTRSTCGDPPALSIFLSNSRFRYYSTKASEG